MTQSTSLEAVRQYYGRILQSSSDLQTSACCATESLPPHIAAVEKLLHDEVRQKFYGCGLVVPQDLTGLTVLDLGSGSGRDAFIISKLVGAKGRVIGVDMTAEQLAVANRHAAFHAQQFGYATSNTTFVQGYIEDLESADIESNSVDLVVSNCVVNLSPAKDRVLREVMRVLKPGGELYFSDVYADRRLPKEFAEDQVLLGECLGGAMYVEDFRRLMLSIGCLDFRMISKAPIQINNPEIARKLGTTKFWSITYRIFKLELEDKCEDYGQVAYYKGTIPECPNAFMLDDHHLLEKGRPMLVCSNTAAMLGQTRFAKHFEIQGDLSRHFGLFPCGPAPITGEAATAAASCAPGGACC